MSVGERKRGSFSEWQERTLRNLFLLVMDLSRFQLRVHAQIAVDRTSILRMLQDTHTHTNLITVYSVHALDTHGGRLACKPFPGFLSWRPVSANPTFPRGHAKFMDHCMHSCDELVATICLANVIVLYNSHYSKRCQCCERDKCTDTCYCITPLPGLPFPLFNSFHFPPFSAFYFILGFCGDFDHGFHSNSRCVTGGGQLL